MDLRPKVVQSLDALETEAKVGEGQSVGRVVREREEVCPAPVLMEPKVLESLMMFHCSTGFQVTWLFPG